MTGPVRTRFAPSPTGYLHIGSARTALFNFLFARRFGGSFVLRIEDTDRARSRSEFEAAIEEDLRWLGLGWDEGPAGTGAYGPYRQSERLRIYRERAEDLLSRGLAYRCYCTRERLEELKQRQIISGLPPRYDGRCREIKAGGNASAAIRFKVPEGKVSFDDGVHGPLEFDTRAFGDFVIIGSDGIASYNFAAAVDDALMSITHIIRGDDHISNTPRQLLLFRALGFSPPLYSHIPLVLGTDRAPLGKRDLSVSLRSLREAGFLPDAILNSIARLGWSPGEGFLTVEEMTERFSIGGLSKSPSAFDVERLRRFNKTAIERTGSPSLATLIFEGREGWPGRIDEKDRLIVIIDAVKHNAETLEDLKRLIRPFTGEPETTEEAATVLAGPKARGVIRAFRAALEEAGEIDEGSWKLVMERVKKETGEKGKGLFAPVRAALTGLTEGIELVNVIRLLGRERSIERLRRF